MLESLFSYLKKRNTDYIIVGQSVIGVFFMLKTTFILAVKE
jgi:hypothetical protein